MPTTHLTAKTIKYPWDKTHFTALTARMQIWDHTVDTVAAFTGAVFAADVLAANATGRGYMQTGFFNEATATDKFAAGAITGALIKTGDITVTQLGANCIAASATGRALMQTGFFTEAKATDAFAAQAIATGIIKDGAVATAKIAGSAVTIAKLAANVCGASQALSGAGAINLTTPTTFYTSTGPTEALTIADSLETGQRKRIVHIVDGGSGVITKGGAVKLNAAITTITFTNIWDWVELEWSGALWNVIGHAGVTIA